MSSHIQTSRSKRRRSSLDGPLLKNGEGKRALYHCNYCARDITELVRIKCAECPDFDLCVECFSVGAQLGQHRNTHAYRVMDHLSFPLFHPQWGADEELLLLEAVDAFGIGNWPAIAEYVGNSNTAAACRAHYFATYVDPPCAPEPAATPELQGLDIHELMKRRVQPRRDGKGKDFKRAKTEPEGDGKHEAIDAPLAASPSPDEGPAEGGTSDGAAPSLRQQHSKQEISGYIPRRDEFDPEYDADAELPIAELEFLSTDSEELTAAKVKQLQIYNGRLHEREARRTFIKAHGLTDVRRLIAAERRRTAYDRRFCAAMRVFERFQPAAEHAALCDGLLLEHKLRARIDELKALRRHGARTFADCEALLEEKKRQENITSGKPSGRPDRHAKAPDDAPLLATPQPFQAGVAFAAAPGAGRAIGITTWKNKRSVPLDITCLPGAEVLTRRERELCTSHRLLPAHYLLLKETMLREVAAHGALSRSEARTMFRLEPARAQRIHELAVTAGWIAERGKEKGTAGGDAREARPKGVSD